MTAGQSAPVAKQDGRNDGTRGNLPAGPGHERHPQVLVRICDLAGRVRGTGFAVDHEGTVVTSHEAVDGMPRLVLHAPGDHVCVVTPESITAVPGSDLALIRTEGLGLPPLPVTVRDSIPAGSYVHLAADGWHEARILGRAPVTYTSNDRFHLVTGAVELAVDGDSDAALGLEGRTAGGPVLDASTGAVLGVLGCALQAGHGAAGFAVTLRDAAAAEPAGPLARLLVRNAATVPGFGADLNLAGVLGLTHTADRDDGPPPVPGHVERPLVTGELEAFERGEAAVLALVGAPGSGRTTELAAHAARRARAEQPGPTLWLRGGDLCEEDSSIEEAVARALDRAALLLARDEEDTGTATSTAVGGEEQGRRGRPRRRTDSSAEPIGSFALPGLPGRTGPTGHRLCFGDISPDRVARLARDTGRPLLLLLDAPEEMPPALAQRLAEWSTRTSGWLRESGARLILACRPEYWEQAGAHFPARQLHGDVHGHLPGCVRLGALTGAEAALLRRRHGLAEDAADPACARHPLALQLLAEVRAALPPDAPGRPGRHEILGAHLDLLCMRIAARLSEGRPHGGRALAAQVCGQVHEAARLSLGPGGGMLSAADFGELFPYASGWGGAVLGEGLFVAAGDGYRFAVEEMGDWLQGTHLDLDAALTTLVHSRRPRAAAPQMPRVPEQRRRRSNRRRPPLPQRPLPLAQHRIGPVVEALLLLGQSGRHAELGGRMQELVEAADELTQVGEHTAAGEAVWWSARLLAETLVRLPDVHPHLGVLHLLADRVVAWRTEGRSAPEGFGPSFWAALPLQEGELFELLRRLVVADGLPGGGERYLDTVAALLKADPVTVQRRLTGWFTDDRRLTAAPAATVAEAAQALLYTHRSLALDPLLEILADCPHRRAEELLAGLAQDETSAVCRAVARWAAQDNPRRQTAAAAHSAAAAAHVRKTPDRELLRSTALTLLSRTDDCALHGSALALLVRDPGTRSRYLPEALRHFASGQAQLPLDALLQALPSDPEAVLAACRTKLLRPGGIAEAGPLLATLAEVDSPASSRRVAELVHDVVRRRPDAAPAVAAYVERRLGQGPDARSVLLPMLTELVRDGAAEVRAELARVAGREGHADTAALRGELLELLLDRESDDTVLGSLLTSLAESAGGRDPLHARALVHRTAVLLARTPVGGERLDDWLVSLARRLPAFAALLADWLADAPENWAPLLGPGTRRTIAHLATEPVPV